MNSIQKKDIFIRESEGCTSLFPSQENIMNKPKIANFNLNESLKDFQVDVIELLRLNNATEWQNILKITFFLGLGSEVGARLVKNQLFRIAPSYISVRSLAFLRRN